MKMTMTSLYDKENRGCAHAVARRMRRLAATLDRIEYGCRERDAVRSA